MIDSFRGEYRWLSNFHMCDVQYNKETFPSTEHAYQAARVLDPDKHQLVRFAPTPALAMRLGRQWSDDPNWKDRKLQVMEDVVRYKFNNNPDIRQKLIDTCDQELIEGNTWGDTFWGYCDGIGENNLGKILMKVRDELKMEEFTDEEIARAINQLARRIYNDNVKVGWWDESTKHGGNMPDKYMIPTKIALMHSEVSEGLEGFRKNLPDDHLPHRPMFEVEMADAIIRELDSCGHLENDVGGAIIEKLAYNAQRQDHKREVRQGVGGKSI